MRRGFESAASAIFATQLYGHREPQIDDENRVDEEQDSIYRVGEGGGEEETPSIIQSPVLSVVASGGFGWAEGPLWVLRPGHEGDPSYGRLLFSAVFENSIFKIEYDGVSRYVRASGCRDKEERRRGGLGCSSLVEPGSNGLAYDPIDGGLFLCEHGSRSVTRLEDNGTHTPVATHALGGKRFNSPNDLVFSSRGDLFFTDPTFGLQGAGSEAQEMPHCGVYHMPREALAEVGGALEERQEEMGEGEKRGDVSAFSKEPMALSEPRLLLSDIPTPNGLAFSPDESVLYVANSGPTPEILAFDVVWGEKGKKKNSKKKSAKHGKSEAASAANYGATGKSKKRKKKKRQSLDELLEELDADDEGARADGGSVGVNDGQAATAASSTGSAGEEGLLSDQDEIVTTANKGIRKTEVGPRVILSNKRTFADFTELSARCDKSAPQTSSSLPYNGPDGLKVDAVGNVYVAGACGVHVFRPSDGERVASLMLPGVRVSNIAFAGDGYLYITASDRVMRIRVGDAVLPALPERMIRGESTEDMDEENFAGGYFW